MALPLFAQSGPAFAHQEDLQTNLVTRRIAKWSGDRMVVVDYDGTDLPVIRTIDREGRDEAIALDIPGARDVHVSDYAAGFDGAIAAVGYALSEDSQIGYYLVWVSPDRKRRTVVRLSPYVAQRVTLAGDGTIWTIGGIRTDNPDRSKDQGDVLKRFDSSGKVLASNFPNGRARAGIAPDASSSSYLFASPDRVGWFTNGNQLIEFALDGRELGRFDGPAGLDHLHISGVALDALDDVVVGDMRERKFEVWRLNRSKRAWEPVSLNWPGKPPYSRILGFDGTTLITAESNQKMNRHMRTSQPPDGGPKP